jgi:hypothetical protein
VNLFNALPGGKVDGFRGEFVFPYDFADLPDEAVADRSAVSPAQIANPPHRAAELQPNRRPHTASLQARLGNAQARPRNVSADSEGVTEQRA